MVTLCVIVFILVRCSDTGEAPRSRMVSTDNSFIPQLTVGLLRARHCARCSENNCKAETLKFAS